MFNSYSIKQKCTCGQESSGVCTTRMCIIGDGIIQQRSDQLLKCGKVKNQLKALRDIKAACMG